MSSYDPLKLENQLCFPLYAASRKVVSFYTPLLAELDLTYTQYITMMVLWEHDSISVKELGKKLYLDSGTLTPLLKNMEKKGLLLRTRSPEDERVTVITLTKEGKGLKRKAMKIPEQISSCVTLDAEDARTLYRVLYQLLESDN